MADILERIGTLLWIALAICGFRYTRRLNRKSDDLLNKLDAEITEERRNGPW